MRKKTCPNPGEDHRRKSESPSDYEAFERVLGEAHQHVPMRTLAYCLMPNHWLCGASHNTGIWCSGREGTATYRSLWDG